MHYRHGRKEQPAACQLEKTPLGGGGPAACQLEKTPLGGGGGLIKKQTHVNQR